MCTNNHVTMILTNSQNSVNTSRACLVFPTASYRSTQLPSLIFPVYFND